MSDSPECLLLAFSDALYSRLVWGPEEERLASDVYCTTTSPTFAAFCLPLAWKNLWLLCHFRPRWGYSHSKHAPSCRC